MPRPPSPHSTARSPRLTAPSNMACQSQPRRSIPALPGGCSMAGSPPAGPTAAKHICPGWTASEHRPAGTRCGLAEVLAFLVLQGDQHPCQGKILVRPELANGIDAERLLQQGGVAIRDAGQCRGRRVEDFFDGLVLVGLVETLCQIHLHCHGAPPPGSRCTYRRGEPSIP